MTEGESKELVTVEVPGVALVPSNLFGSQNPNEVIARAGGYARALASVVKDRHLYKKIGDKAHVFVEGWTLLGSMLGVFPVCVWTKEVDGGWEARVEARTLSGQLVGAAESQCLRTESKWKGRDDYALRSMAQTRATSKALRLPLGFIMVLAGYNATPAEEMPDDSEKPEAPRERTPLEALLEEAKERAREKKCSKCDREMVAAVSKGGRVYLTCGYVHDAYSEAADQAQRDLVATIAKSHDFQWFTGRKEEAKDAA